MKKILQYNELIHDLTLQIKQMRLNTTKFNFPCEERFHDFPREIYICSVLEILI